MNRHFIRENDRPTEVPRRAYARVDHLERDDEHPETILLGFDLIDADWLDGQGDVDPSWRLSRSPRQLDNLWRTRCRSLGPGAPNPFEHAPLYRLELVRGPGETLYSPMDAATLERSWFTVELAPSPKKNSPALLYGGLFASATPVIVEGLMPSGDKKSEALDAIFSLKYLPKIHQKAFARVLEGGSVHADYLAVYDVGQGNANALAAMAANEGPLVPTLYYDLGAGVYRNAATTPPDLRFCFSYNPLIVLSHWDADHWAGAYATAINGKYPALRQTWIAPLQKVGPLHTAFAYDVTCAGGEFIMYAGTGGTSGTLGLRNNRKLHYVRGSGTRRNGSGLVLMVTDENHPYSRSWLLTGDCDYSYFVPAINPENIVAMVAPHHGASLLKTSPVPPPANLAYRRLVYSFGPQNRHGRSEAPVRHPTHHGVTPHAKSGWSHGTWKLPVLGTPLPGGDVLATCEHLGGTSRSGAVIGWDGPPPPMSLSCPRQLCNAPCAQR